MAILRGDASPLLEYPIRISIGGKQAGDTDYADDAILTLGIEALRSPVTK